mgnify:CR=1 FL=1
MIQDLLVKIVQQENLTEIEAMLAMEEIMEGQATPAQIASFLTGLRMKGETVEEITGCAKGMKKKAQTINPGIDNLVDTCGTGGDGLGTFNISTAVAIVAAGAGLAVAKHGNRAVSSKSGSADVLEALGIKVDLCSEEVVTCIEKVGIGFLFAPNFHQAMKYAAGPRRELGLRTIFNILGPLTNPASPTGQVLGVYNPDLTELMAQVLSNLGVARAYVVHGYPGLDEISLVGETKVSELRDGVVKTYYLNPEDLGFARVSLEELKGGSCQENAQKIIGILEGQKGPSRDIVILNAAAALVVGDKVRDLREGIELAAQSIDEGKAFGKLQEWKDFSQEIVRGEKRCS